MTDGIDDRQDEPRDLCISRSTCGTLLIFSAITPHLAIGTQAMKQMSLYT